MDDRETDKLRKDVIDSHVEFQTRLHSKGQFPSDHFRALFDAVVRYVEATKDDVMIHKDVTSAVSGDGFLFLCKRIVTSPVARYVILFCTRNH